MRQRDSCTISVERKRGLVLRYLVCVTVLAASTTGVVAQRSEAPPAAVSVGSDGKLQYAADPKGNQVPDFSYCGYKRGEQPIPQAPARVVVPRKAGDATHRIQAAIDYVAALTPDKNGIRGAVLLEEGQYEVRGSLKITTSGVVLRGSGMGESGTILIGTTQSRETLITIAGKNDRIMDASFKITDSYVPVNAKRLRVASSNAFKPGDRIMVHRPSTQAWIDTLHMKEFGGESGWLGWKPGQRDIYWDREIVAVENTSLVLDAPITTAIEVPYGGGAVARYQWPGRITQVGVENISLQSVFNKDNPKDEDHRWMAITFENVSDGWVRQVTFKHFAGSAVSVFETASRITIEDCLSLAPVSEIGGQRRYTFFTMGQQTLFQRLYAEYGYHDFAVGFCAAGPNAFVQCDSYLPFSFSGTLDSWASGVLFDIVNVEGQALGFCNRRQDGQGAGWTAANSVLWQCTAARIDCYKPPTAQNWAFGAWAQFAGDGYWSDPNSHINPRSLYYAQLAERLGNKNIEQDAHLLTIETEASSSPPIETALALTAKSNTPILTLREWIMQASQRQPIATTSHGIKTIDEIGVAKAYLPVPEPSKSINKNGWLICGDAVMTGKRQDVSWWRGDIRPFEVKKAKPHITRFVPGRVGTGLTDDLHEVTNTMKGAHVVALEHNYGLWYDRRRDDHERVRRMDGDVWPPFYELPFIRSGQGIAWDGLSQYDLTRYNPWYWSRLKQFADLANQKGLLLVHQHYFQHNILEAGAHWADFPWRTANNINDAGFPEPPPYAGDKRIFMAAQFYDVTHPVRRLLHKAYIRQCLANFENNQSVLQLIGAEYTGPLHFAQFWLDTILEWERETGKKAMVGLSVTKDVQDTLLADAVRTSAIDVIDIRYWHYREDGSVYAPAGGKNLAPRQHARLVKPGKQSFEQVYRAVREYRTRYPQKAVIYSAGNAPALEWAVFMAGGSLADIPPVSNADFLRQAANMKPVDDKHAPVQQWTLGDSEQGFIVYSMGIQPVKIDLTGIARVFNVRWIDPVDGRIIEEEKKVKAGKVVELKSPRPGAVVAWLSRK